jgi:hypothetical protein
MHIGHALFAKVSLAPLERERAKLALDLIVKEHLLVRGLGLRTGSEHRGRVMLMLMLLAVLVLALMMM